MHRQDDPIFSVGWASSLSRLQKWDIPDRNFLSSNKNILSCNLNALPCNKSVLSHNLNASLCNKNVSSRNLDVVFSNKNVSIRDLNVSLYNKNVPKFSDTFLNCDRNFINRDRFFLLDFPYIKWLQKSSFFEKILGRPHTFLNISFCSILRNEISGFQAFLSTAFSINSRLMTLNFFTL